MEMLDATDLCSQAVRHVRLLPSFELLLVVDDPHPDPSVSSSCMLVVVVRVVVGARSRPSSVIVLDGLERLP